MTDHSVDLAIVGSGGGGLIAALAALDAGLKPLIIEKQRFVGGSTAMSGGVVWMPNNPVMLADGVPDSHKAGLEYLDAAVGDIGPASTIARREAFLENGSAMVTMLINKGVKLIRCRGYSDYYDLLPGGHAEGRSIEGIPWDLRQLGEWQDKVNPGMTRSLGLVVTTTELNELPLYTRSLQSFLTSARVFLRTAFARFTGRDLVTNGMSLVGQTLKVVLDSGIPVWLNSPVTDLIVEDGRVVGVEVERDGSPVAVRASRGVLLAAGGFERNAEMRRKFSGDQPNEAQWTVGNLGNTGEVLSAAMALGAKTDLMDEAWWNPLTVKGLQGTTFNVARKLPGTICVNKAAKRFVNESNSYVEFCQAQYAHNSVPCWLIFDDGFRRRYPMTRPRGLNIIHALPGRLEQKWIEDGWITKADTPEELARKIGLDPATLAATIASFNEAAGRGHDPEFGRGLSAYNKVMGDRAHHPNAAIGPLSTPPYYATAIFPSDVGTCGGLITDEHGRVLAEDDHPIPGLYATGNITATVTGRTYPGAGASIANTMAFGFAAARHVAQQEPVATPAAE